MQDGVTEYTKVKPHCQLYNCVHCKNNYATIWLMLGISKTEFKLDIIPFLTRIKLSPLSGFELGSPDPEEDAIPCATLTMCHLDHVPPCLPLQTLKLF